MDSSLRAAPATGLAQQNVQQAMQLLCPFLLPPAHISPLCQPMVLLAFPSALQRSLENRDTISQLRSGCQTPGVSLHWN